MFSKVEVDGPNTHPVFKYLRVNSCLYSPFFRKTRKIILNFSKFIVDKDGKVVKFLGPEKNPLRIKPDLDEVIKSLWKFLNICNQLSKFLILLYLIHFIMQKNAKKKAIYIALQIDQREGKGEEE